MAKTDVSAALFERAQKVIPGGVNSPVRACRSIGGEPLFITLGVAHPIRGHVIAAEDGAPVAGVPILASPFPEMKKTIETNGTGRLLADPVTAENVAAVVASITDEDLARMRESCRTFMERDGWAVYGQRLVDLYDDLLARGERTPAVETTKTTPAMAVPLPR